MYLKKLMITVLLVMSGAVTFAQTDVKKGIEKDFNKFLALYVSKDFEKAVEYIVPEFFDFYPKERLITILEQNLNNPAMEITVTNAAIKQIEEPQKIEDHYYVLVSYGIQLNLKMNPRENETPEKTALRITTIKEAFTDVYGKGKVNYNETTSFFEIQQEKHAYAISANKTSWKFLEVDDKDSQEIYKKLLPPALYDKIKIETPKAAN